jgi:hypothetical protein
MIYVGDTAVLRGGFTFLHSAMLALDTLMIYGYSLKPPLGYCVLHREASTTSQGDLQLLRAQDIDMHKRQSSIRRRK